ncbi:hypothetical protein WJX73_010933 [Symbiochloris irregularis]|uniref:Eukaryotic translation initiation factor 3 subunit K n=1 Tax=Symbiochloris irregularis TaxID=706552 RepID=A0AAW1PLE1_9CHLO
MSPSTGYTAEKLPELEVAFEEQVEHGTYDLDACLTLLRLYSFSPEHVNINVISKILIKAMLQLPSPDFALMLNMIPERLQDEQPLAALIALTQHLEGARFQAFWVAVDSCRDIVKSVPGFFDAVRAYILGAICSTCQKVTKGTLADSLRLDGAPLDDLIQQKIKTSKWTTASSPTGKTILVLPKNEFNVIRGTDSSQSSHRGYGLTDISGVLLKAQS